MKLKLNPATLYTKKEGPRKESTLFKVKWEVLPVKLEALLKRNFLYETFSSKFLRSHFFEVLGVASCERLYSPSHMLYKIGLLKYFIEFSGKRMCL